MNCNVDLYPNPSYNIDRSSSSILESWVGIFGQMTPTFKTSKFFSSAIYIWLEDQWRWSVIWHFQTHYNILYVKSVTRLMVWQESIMLGLIHFSLIGKMQNPSYILFNFFYTIEIKAQYAYYYNLKCFIILPIYYSSKIYFLQGN